MNALAITPMTLADIPAVLAMEQAAYQEQWPRRDYPHELTHNRYAHYLLLRHQGVICGVAGFWLLGNEAHITTIAIDPTCQRQGWGAYLLRQLTTHAATCGAAVMTLEVRSRNHQAIALYHAFGFSQTGLRANYYHDDHALILTVSISNDDLTHEPI